MFIAESLIRWGIAADMEDDSEKTLKLAIGSLKLSLGIILPPFYIRFIYIFVSRKKYRSLECYQIMIFSGILQLFAGPAAICSGLLHLIGYDPHNIFLFVIIVFSASIAAELCLNLVLALNRLKVIFDISIPTWIYKILMTIDCLYGIAYAGLLMSPYCGYVMRVGHFTGFYDFSKPYTQLFNTVNCVLMTGSSVLTFLCYLAIVVKILWSSSKTTAALKKERTVFIYAGVRFSIDIGQKKQQCIGHSKDPELVWMDMRTEATVSIKSTVSW
uniref:7TM_GPCR_Srx domain-containing protein n=1 Tax=Steinernema glaseri TaxID=37863 RepID=A0A1I7YN38_9BILA